jgi:CubicO group peptidase (beta-lactamase class C family)
MGITRRHWIGLASTLVLSGAALADKSQASTRIISHGRRDPGPLLAALSDFAQAELYALKLPGLSIGVAGPDNFRATITLGFADIEKASSVQPDHLFQIGSISKSLVALCVCHLADQGKFRLDQSAASILPDILWPEPAPTIAMLLNHSAGLAADAPLFPRTPDGRLWVNFPAGARFAYSNAGFNLLGMIVARASGMPFARAIQTMVLEPLGMSATHALIRTQDRSLYATGYYPYDDRTYLPGGVLTQGPWLDIDTPAGSIAAPPEDMARYAAYLCQLGQGRGAPLFSDAMARRYCHPTIAAPQFGDHGQYAMGMATIDIDGRQCLHHTGGMINFRSSITVDPAVGGVFASTNAGAGGYRPRRITDYGCRLLRAFNEQRSLPEGSAIAPIPPVEGASRFVGRFLAETGDVITISAEGDQLVVTARAHSGRLSATGGGLFRTDHPIFAEHEFFFVDNAARNLMWWGGTLYGRDHTVTTPRPMMDIAHLAGRYVNDSPWEGSVSIVARGEQLVVEGFGPLQRAIDGSWRSATGHGAAERFRFEAMMNGRPQRLSFSGVDFIRFHGLDE